MIYYMNFDELINYLYSWKV